MYHVTPKRQRLRSQGMEEREKLVLVSYLERNKIIRIPSSINDELAYLKKEFKKSFSFGENVNLDITFQKFDSEWDQYIDLESPVVFIDKDKLKAVVTPLLEVPGRNSANISSISTFSSDTLASSLEGVDAISSIETPPISSISSGTRASSLEGVAISSIQATPISVSIS